MGFELSTGTLYITADDKTTKLLDCVSITEETELSENENQPCIYHLNDTSSFSFEVNNADLTYLDNYYSPLDFNNEFIIESYIDIMIQARWHKKPRIRKKWLKRFGMKPDTVKMRANATAGEYCGDDGSFEFETDIPEYIWRPDQLRSGLKIEW